MYRQTAAVENHAQNRTTAAVEDHAQNRTEAAESRTGQDSSSGGPCPGQDSSGIQVDIGRIGIKIK